MFMMSSFGLGVLAGGELNFVYGCAVVLFVIFAVFAGMQLKKLIQEMLDWQMDCLIREGYGKKEEKARKAPVLHMEDFKKGKDSPKE